MCYSEEDVGAHLDGMWKYKNAVSFKGKPMRSKLPAEDMEGLQEMGTGCFLYLSVLKTKPEP
ncbi:hypothetical protein SAY86_005140 [Trapa natans]|uniref:Uncharacterized protein n=1 Tax=Trapa natans TaxID=22666 RepID=A0AAN7L8L1_TRANT|nr:hypothetical protein SAY86_005140 [Trapa natans]